METSRSEARYLSMPVDAEEDEIAVALAAVLTYLSETAEAPQLESNVWSLAGRRESHDRRTDWNRRYNGWRA